MEIVAQCIAEAHERAVDAIIEEGALTSIEVEPGKFMNTWELTDPLVILCAFAIVSYQYMRSQDYEITENGAPYGFIGATVAGLIHFPVNDRKPRQNINMTRLRPCARFLSIPQNPGCLWIYKST